ncbi:MAG TPA: hypothetical protein PLO78_00650 [Candidatus Omnitrophota bacterium]|nr:hypothetical protein [Candidatus Omnitrophota bacterium]
MFSTGCKRRISIGVAVFFFLFQITAFAEITYKDLKLSETFFPKPVFVTSVSVIENPQTPGFLTFSFQAPSGAYKAQGLVAYRKLLLETEIIQQLDTNESTSGGVAQGAVDSVKDTGRGLKNLVVHPVDSAQGIGRGVGKLGSKIGGAFQKKEEGEKESAGDSFLGSTKRDLAKKLGVDVYSRNEELQKRLNSMAKARMGGRGVVAVATFFMPVGLLASAVVTVSSINSAADQLVNDNDKADLYKLNEKALLVLGFPQGQVTRFLNHPYYTPRELTYLRFYLEKLKNVSGYRNIFSAALDAPPGVFSDQVLYEAQIAADAMSWLSDIERLSMLPEGLLVERKNAVILIAAYDYLDASAFGKKIADKVYSLKLKLGKNSAEIWNGGVVSDGYGGAMLLRGIKLRRMCLFGKTGLNEQMAV